MNVHLKHSRIAKTLVDRLAGAMSFEDSEAFLRATKVAIFLDGAIATSPAAQAAALTAMTTAVKCFGSAVIVADATTPLLKPLRYGATIGEAATFFRVTLSAAVPKDTTHTILIGDCRPEEAGDFVRCWWDGWRAGVLPAWDDRELGAGFNPLSGVAAGALAVREVFAARIGNGRAGKRASLLSLWEPWVAHDKAAPGPALVALAAKLWFVGLGHLGQGFLWSLAQLPVAGGLLVLQDDQRAGEENEATGLLTYGESDVGERKARVAASWFESAWDTSLIERRHHGDICVTVDDPTILFAGLDNVPARLNVTGAGFDYVVDAGVGHGAADFESFQLRVLRKDADLKNQWTAPEKGKDVDAMLEREGYRDLAKKDRCGAFELAEGSVAVPFVGAFVGALGIAQAMRVSSGEATAEFLQAELGAPSLATAGRMNEIPSEAMKLLEIRVA
jgi:hypothetical protein